jgi:hypothetical protein
MRREQGGDSGVGPALHTELTSLTIPGTIIESAQFA